MVRSYGMDKSLGQVALDSQRFDADPLAADLMRGAERIVKEHRACSVLLEARS